MKTRRRAPKLWILLAVAAVTIAVAGSALAASPLSADDVTLLLIGGSPAQKIVSLVQQRGIDFKLTPALTKEFREDGANDDVMDALLHAKEQPAPSMKSAASPAASSSSEPMPNPRRSAPGPLPVTAPPAPGSTAASIPVTNSSVNPVPHAPSLAVPAKPAKAAAPPQPKPAPTSDAPLPDPPPANIPHIIQAFAAKELEFQEARNNYTYHQMNKAETVDANGDVDGTWEQDWDIMFDQNGNRIEKVTYAPPGSLGEGVLMTEQDVKAFQTIQPFVLTTQDLTEYNVSYLGHVHVDYLTCYVFSVRPKEIKKHHQYFDGVVWVDDRDLQVVKAEGRNVPQLKDNRFPRFTTWRQQIDGKYWFPTFTKANDVLYFNNGGPPVHIVEIIRYTDYKQFKAKSRIISVTALPSTPPPSPPKH
jgi:hypothetical protein